MSKIAWALLLRPVAPDAQEAGRVVHAALDLGINFFDTANVYGATPTFDRPGAPPATKRETAEQLLGRFLVGRRDDVVIATKSGERRLDPAAGCRAGTPSSKSAHTSASRFKPTKRAAVTGDT